MLHVTHVNPQYPTLTPYALVQDTRPEVGKLFDSWATLGSKNVTEGSEQQQMNGEFWWATS